MHTHQGATRFSAIVIGLAVSACGSTAEEDSELRAFAAGGGGALTQVANLEAQYPIVFHSDRGGLRGDAYALYVMSPDGGGRDAIPVTEPGMYFQPRWSPDGRSIAFRSELDGVSAEIGVVDAADGQLVTLTHGEGPALRNRAPAWSPDGEQIAFDSVRPEEGEGVWVVPRLGGPAERLLPGVDVQHRDAAWSPDGSRIAYSARTGEGRLRDLFVAERDDLSNAVQLTRGEAYAPHYLSWSPDGSRILMAGYGVLEDGSPEPEGPSTDGRYVPPDTELFVCDVESGVVTRLTDNGDIDTEPAWAPDGLSVIYTRAFWIDGDLDVDLWRMPLDAPETAYSLIDDEDNPTEEGGADWYYPPEPR